VSQRPETIADTSTLSNFARSGWWWLLEKMFPKGMFTTDDVMEEIEKGIDKGYDLNSVIKARGNWLEIIETLNNNEVTVLKQLRKEYKSIRQGAEATVLAIAKVRELTCLVDDKVAIRAAREQNISVITTHDIVQWALHESILDNDRVQQLRIDLEQKARFKLRSE